jgi:signal transduction histidine kinase
MSYVNKIGLKELLQKSDSRIFNKKTILRLIRSILEPIAQNGTPAMVFTRIINSEGIEGILKRLEYSELAKLYDLSDVKYIPNYSFENLEFVLATSSMFCVFLMWDYSKTDDENSSQIVLIMNSNSVNDIFETLQSKMSIDLKEEFYQYKPERRENFLLNEVIGSIVGILDENIVENEFRKQEEILTAKKIENGKKYEKTREICHEIKNQLSVIDVWTKVLEKQQGECDSIGLIRKSTEVILEQIRELRREENFNIEKYYAQETIKTVIGMTKEILKQNNNTVLFSDKEQKTLVLIDENKFLIVLLNIIKNANESAKNSKIEIDLEEKAGYLNIRIKNNGPKIPDEIKDKIFEKDFTTKEKGWGLGLFICRKYIEKMQGKLELAHSDKDYTEFLIKIKKAD